jgi:GT2 family glycosyltransferase
MVVEGADLAAALAVVGRQVYEPGPEVVIVGAGGETPEGYESASGLEQAIADTPERTDYLWILHSDARPRPDALGALVAEVSRNEASLGGSKLLVAGSKDMLESVGSATDVFGEPYSGLEEGEIDLQQYDVVREVAFVRSASMLVRRDLAQGLRGLDVLLPPVAAGLDFSQRSRLAGGRVISVPSSEVYHQGRCNERLGGWREQAGRLRAMLTAYRPLTLLWVVPYDILVALTDSLANLLLFRWRPAARHFMSWAWNLYHLPSTIGLRRRLKTVRVSGDEELFRFQARGSVRLRDIGSELSARVLSVFDDDQALTRRTRRVWASPGIWGAMVAVAVALFCARSLVFTGVPNSGFSFPFESPLTGFDRWLAGWNDSGLGSPSAMHPSNLVTAIASSGFFGREGAARNVVTIALGVIGIAGIGRFGGRLGLRGPGRYLAGLVLMAGPGTALLTGAGSWTALAASAMLPWAARAVLAPTDEASPLGRYGWAILLGLPLAALSPALILVPWLALMTLPAPSGRRDGLWLAAASLLGLTAAIPFLLDDPGWITDATRRLHPEQGDLWPVLIGVAALPTALLDSRSRRVGLVGGVTSLAALLGARVPFGGPGAEEGLLVVASFGAAMVVSAGLDALTREPRRLMSALASAAVVVVSVGTLANGFYGLAAGDLNQRLGFASTLAGASGPGRILMASTVRSDLPGEVRSGPGFWYRLVDGAGMTSDEVWLPGTRPGDDRLAATLESIASGGELRSGAALSQFAVDWVVLDGPAFRLDEVLVDQLDLVPTPLDPETRVFENTTKTPIADAGDSVWRRVGAGFGGDLTTESVRLALNHADGWEPGGAPVDWAVGVDGTHGEAGFRGPVPAVVLAALSPLLLVAGLVLVLVGRSRR